MKNYSSQKEKRVSKEMIQTFSTIAVALICPLMMIFMMKGMHGHSSTHSMHGSSKRKFGSREEELDDLKEQLADLQAEYDQLSSELRRQSPESRSLSVSSPHLVKSHQ